MFRGYDVRGVYGSEVTDEKITRLANSLSKRTKEIVTGFDYRAHSRKLNTAFAKGFSGRVYSIGYCPTSAVSYNARKYGLMFTASHNPAEYAGVKFVRERHTVFEDELTDIEKEFDRQKTPKAQNAQVIDSSEMLEKYADALPPMNEKCIYDLAGGAACSLNYLFANRMFDTPDPLFEKHAPEPKDSTLDALKRKTVEKGALGLAFDGDADRCMAVSQGKLIDGGVMTAWLCENEFSKKDRVVVNIDFTDEVKDYLRDSGVKVSVCAVGTTNVVTALIKENAVLGAERNGHYYFAKHVPDSDGLYAAALFSKAKPKELTEFASQFKHVLLTEAIAGKADFTKIRQAIEQDDSVIDSSFLDGVYARFENYTLLMRASQTEPKIRVNSEAENNAKAKAGLEKGRSIIKKSLVN